MESTMLRKEDLETIFKSGGFRGDVLYREPLSKHTSLRIGGPADAFIVPSDMDSLKYILKSSYKAGLPIIVLGGGTNVLISDDGVRAIVISLSEFNEISLDGTVLRVGAGVGLQGLVNHAGKNGLSGIEGLSGIPGTVGGAVAGNAGSFGTEIKDVLTEVSIVGKDGVVGIMSAEALGLEYRKANIPEGSVIVDAILRLKKDEPKEVLRRITEYLRQKKTTQPIGERSAGCVFKNPKGVSAGKLIEEAGCKGLRYAGVEVSPVHANFFIAKGRARAEDFLRLMDVVSKRVKDAFGIVLEPEIKTIGC